MGRPSIGESTRKENAAAYQNTLYRSTFAIKKDLEAGLKRAIAASGAASVSDLLARLAQEPEKTGAVLRPVFEAMPKRMTISDVVENIKSSDLTPEEIAAAIARAQEAKAASASAP